jgi:hypothetical protein
MADGKSAWLSDASREYMVTYLQPVAGGPQVEDLKPGQRLALGKEMFTAMDMEDAESSRARASCRSSSCRAGRRRSPT